MKNGTCENKIYYKKLFSNYPYICFCCGKPLMNAEYSYSGAVLCYEHYVKLNELSNGIKREQTDHSNYEKHTQF